MVIKDSDAKDARGRYVKGLAPGKPVGAKDRKVRGTVGPRVQQRIIRDNAAAIQAAAGKHMMKALECLGVSAETDPASAERFLRLVANPPPPRVYIDGAAALSGLNLEDRLPALSALMSDGRVDIAAGTAMANIIKLEIEYKWLRPLRLAVREMEQAMKGGDRKRAEEALQRLAHALNTAAPAINAEVVDEQ